MLNKDAKDLFNAIATMLNEQRHKRGRKRILNEWEMEFLNSMQVMLKLGKDVTDRQGLKLGEIYRRLA